MKRLYHTLGRFLDAVAESSEPLDVGRFGPGEKYTSFEQVRIGPLVNSLQSSGFLVRADASNSERPSRNRAIVRRWLPACPDSCRLKAAEYRRRAESLPDDDDLPHGPTQRLLF
jgi:hypothetical protein